MTAEPEAADPRDAVIEMLKARIIRMTAELKRWQKLRAAGGDELELREEVVRLRSEIDAAHQLAAAARAEREDHQRLREERLELRQRVDALERQALEALRDGRKSLAQEEQAEWRRKVENLERQVAEWKQHAEELVRVAGSAGDGLDGDGSGGGNGKGGGAALALLETENRALKERMEDMRLQLEEALGEMRRERLSHRRMMAELKAYKLKYESVED